MREHDISSGRVGTIENDSIPDGKRGINGIDIFLIVDLNFIGGIRNFCGRISRLASRIRAKLPYLNTQRVRTIRHKNDYQQSR